MVVVNGEGGLDDPELEGRVRMVRLPSNVGPAGGFHQGLVEAFADPDHDLGLSVRGRHGPVAPAGARASAGLMARLDAHGGRGRGRGRRLRPELHPPLRAQRQRRAPAWPGRRAEPGGRVDVGCDARFARRGRCRGPSRLLALLRVRGLRLLLSHARRGVLGPRGRRSAPVRWRTARPSPAATTRCSDTVPTTPTSPGGRTTWPGTTSPWPGATAGRAGSRGISSIPLRRLQLADERGRAAWPRSGACSTGPGAGSASTSLPARGRRRGHGPVADEASGGDTGPDRAGGDRARGRCRPARSDLGPGTVALVLSHNAPQALARCLDAIEAQTVRPARWWWWTMPAIPRCRVDDLGTTLPVRSIVRSDTNLGPAGGWALAFEELLARRGRLRLGARRRHRGRPRVPRDPAGPGPPRPQGGVLLPRAVQPDGTVGEWGSWCGFVISRAHRRRGGRAPGRAVLVGGGQRVLPLAHPPGRVPPAPGGRGRGRNTTPSARARASRCGSTTTRPATCCTSTSTSCTGSAGTRGT